MKRALKLTVILSPIAFFWGGGATFYISFNPFFSFSLLFVNEEQQTSPCFEHLSDLPS